jgi:predicted phosphodiesterase
MKVLKVHVPYSSRGDVINLYPLGDLHLGHINTDVELVEGTVKRIAADKHARVIGMGDYGNTDIPGDKYFDFNSLDLGHYPTPDLQYSGVERLFNKIKGKIDILLTGNHDDRMAVKHNHNFVQDIASEKKLNVPWAWSSAYIRYIFTRGRTKANAWTFDVYATHGFAVEMRKQGSRLNRLLEMTNVFPEADLYLMGHVHTLHWDKKTPLRITQELEIQECLKYYVLTGGFLRGYVDGNPSYVERKMLEPSALGSPMIAIRPYTHEVRVQEVQVPHSK